jgi:hypothetical protein
VPIKADGICSDYLGWIISRFVAGKKHGARCLASYRGNHNFNHLVLDRRLAR